MTTQDKRNSIYRLVFWTSVIMSILGFTGLAFVPVSDQRYLDMLAVPVIIGSMIGAYTICSYAPSIILGIVWTVMIIIRPPAGCMPAPIIAAAIVRVPIGMSAAIAYNMLRRLLPRNHFNSFIASPIALAIRAVITAVAAVLLQKQPVLFAIKTSLMHFAIESAFATVILLIIIDKLRSMNLLNGHYIGSKHPSLIGRYHK